MDLHQPAAPAIHDDDPDQQFLVDASSPSSRDSAFGPHSSASTARSRPSVTESHVSGGRGSHDSKPRLSKEQHETLERHYQCEPKPSTQTKKEFSTRLGVSVEKVNNWFQNRRAKTKHELKKQQEAHALFAGGPVDFNVSEQFGHPLADNHLIDEAFYQTIGGAPEPAMQHFRRAEHSMVDAPSFSNFPTIPEEPAVIGEDPGFYNFFGLSEGNDEQKVDMNTVAEIRKQFNPPSLQDFDPAAMLRQAQEAYRNGSSAAWSSTELSSAHPSQDFSAAGSLPGLHDSRRASSSVVSMTTAPTASRTSSTSWNQQQQEHFFANMNRSAFQAFGPDALFPESANFDFNSAQAHHLRRDSALRSPTEQTDMGVAFNDSNTAMPQPVLPSQTLAGQQLSQGPPSQAFDSLLPMMQQQQQQQQQQVPVPSPGSRVPSRCDSGTSMLADSMDRVELQAIANGSSNDLKRSHSASTLAARRHRRPAQLGSASLRSISYHNGSTPGSEHGSFSSLQEYPLRRIKSSTMVGGRIQKPGSVSSQRSPYAIGFPDAAPRSPAPFTPVDTTGIYNWSQGSISNPGQIHHPMPPPMHRYAPHLTHLQQAPPAPLPLQMAQQLHTPQPMDFSMDNMENNFAYPPQMTPTESSFLPPTPHDSQASSTPPHMSAKATPELQIQTYQPRDPVDSDALPPKGTNAPLRGNYQFQNFHQGSFTSPGGSSLKTSTMPP